VSYDWNKFPRPRVALINRIMRWVLPCIGLAAWLACLPLALRDWTVIFAPLIFTAGAVMHHAGVRTVYRAERHRPGYAAASSPCSHRNAVPVEAVTGEVIAKLCPDCDEQLEAGFVPGFGPIASMFLPPGCPPTMPPAGPLPRPKARCYCNYCQGRAGVHGDDAKALYQAEVAAAMDGITMAEFGRNMTEFARAAEGRTSLGGSTCTSEPAAREPATWHWNCICGDNAYGTAATIEDAHTASSDGLSAHHRSGLCPEMSPLPKRDEHRANLRRERPS